MYEPTAMQNVVLGHDTPSSVSPLFPGFRLAESVHDRPFHLSTSVLWSASNAVFEYAPVAMQKVAFVQETPSRSSVLDPGFLLAVIVHELLLGERSAAVLGPARYAEVAAVVVLRRLVEAADAAGGQHETATAIGTPSAQTMRNGWLHAPPRARNMRITMHVTTSRS